MGYFSMNPVSFCLAGWMNRHQQVVIEYLGEEVRVLQEEYERTVGERFVALSFGPIALGDV